MITSTERGFWFLTTPYTKFAGGTTQAAAMAILEVGRLHQAGVLVFSPVAHSHAIIEAFDDIAGRFKAWADFDMALLRPAIGLIVLELPGWDVSEGVAASVDLAMKLEKQIVYMVPGVLPAELAPGLTHRLRRP